MNTQTTNFDDAAEIVAGIKQDSQADEKNLQDLNEKMDIVRKGSQAYLEAVQALRDIQDQELYLCIKDAQGNPRYRTFEDFLKNEFGYTRSNYCRMKNASDTYQLFREKYGKKYQKLMDVLPQNVSVLYELSKIPEERHDEIMHFLSEDVSHGTPITRDRIIQLRKSGSAQETNTAHCEAVDEDEAAASVETCDKETEDERTPEEHVIENQPLPADDDYDDEQESDDEEEDIQNTGKSKFDQVVNLLKDNELLKYVADSEEIRQSFQNKCHEAMDLIEKYHKEHQN